ncbi:glutamine--fructose-6-phosphate transaminase (isomerizing) [Ilyobacter polytropus]|uniref:Glutamine--fructose-6-phosphate aminotransferase [isomerizing] n=1 Tax=Ilyobacter polytropus (strain ATCC 51220 / DSM 2926 / LMG 16218 / CuHBu1) TaxID=572544 RepID=E3H9C7_ILYPC|nr:glutamine--fructose-6-phosphate transaminase (isomerizing) [Ilyobacter polytropus]ADO83036.1 glucosamine/fructose-6-phosphate aminotransferase, isomerizing [Ilyobacter polytropus DSM 2926]
MCGIVGYVGDRDASGVILDGLSRLEYRGYDSAGIAVSSGDKLIVKKKQGRLKNLQDYIDKNPIEGHVAIGHTRWATHGKPSDENSHPHSNATESISVVHNGIIENYIEIKKELIEKGYEFLSDTDTEVLAHLLDLYLEEDFFATIQKVLKKVKGSYGLGILNTKYPDTVFCARKDSPLVIGLGKDENFIASDVPALLKYTKDVYFLENGEIGIVKKDSVEVYDIEKNEIKKEMVTIEWSLEQATKAGYPHFMLKEINEQPEGIRETIKRRVDENNLIHFDDINLGKEELKAIKDIYIIACGTAYNAGLQGRFALQKIAKIKADADIASEFRYSDPFMDETTLVILVSQSGETLDTLAALREAKLKGAKTLAITNVIGSSIAREADNVIYTWAGPEIAVASTKAYTTQVVVFYMLSLYIAKLKEIITDEDYTTILNGLNEVPEKIEKIIAQEDKIKAIAEKIKDCTQGFYLGRGLDYSVATEASLKMKEVAYMHTEAFASGELKHGTIALIEDDIPVVAITTQSSLFEKSVSNIKEVKARGAYVISVTQENNKVVEEVSDEVIYIPETDDLIAGITAIVPLQLLAYHVSAMRGIDVDKPRNLAKSVTVE